MIAGTPAASELFCTGRTNRIQDLVGNVQRFGRRGDISNLVVALSATSKSPLDIYCHFSETFPQELLRSIRSVFTASAWPEQVLFWSADYPREAADSLVRRLPFGELGALAARRLGPSIAIWWVR